MRSPSAGTVVRSGMALAALALGTQRAAAAQDLMPVCSGGSAVAFSVAPTLNSAPSFKERFGAEAEASLCLTGINELGDGGWHGFALSGRVLVVDRDVESPDISTLRGSFLLGFTKFSETISDMDLDDLDPTADPTQEDDEAGITSWGFFEFGASAAYEENTARSERAVTGGAMVRYGHESNSWVPSLSLRYDMVRPVQSDARAARTLDEEDVHGRFSADLYWRPRLAFVSRTLEDFSIGAELSYFRANGLDADLVTLNDDWESGVVGAATAGWNGGVRIGRVAVDEIYLRYATGRRGIDAEEVNGVRVGIALAVTSRSGSN